MTTLTTTVRMIRPSTSSATAAPSTIRASVVASARRSPKTRAVMPTLVAVSAAPRKIAVSVSQPRPTPAPAPATNGTATPMTATSIEARPTRPELGEVHLHADLDEQQQHAELGEHAEADAALAAQLDEPEHGRADDDAGDDLAEHGRDADPLGALRGELGRDDDDEQVEQQSRQVDGLHGRRSLSRASTTIASAMAITSGLQPPAAPAHRHDGVRAEGPPDADEHRLATSRAELVEAGVAAQLVAVDDPAAVVDERGQDRTLPRTELDIHGARRVLLSHAVHGRDARFPACERLVRHGDLGRADTAR